MENIPMDKHILQQFLKAGFLEKGSFHRTEAGVPQGGSISPTIANMTLDGLTAEVKAAADKVKSNAIKKGVKTSPWVHLIRYADDFVVTAASKRMLEGPVLQAVQNFLNARGLSLNLSKTHITSIKAGFDFVGFHFKCYLWPKAPGGLKLLIKPSKASIRKLKNKIKEICAKGKNLDAVDLLTQLNPVLMGWANYYRKVVRSKVFNQIGNYLWHKLWKWCKTKHPKLFHKELKRKYFKTVGGNNWVFYGTKGNKPYHQFIITDVKIMRHTLIMNKNPYLPENEAYFLRKDKARSKSNVWAKAKLAVRKRTGFICKVCDQIMTPEQAIDIHHILPKKLGGTDAYKNLIR